MQCGIHDENILALKRAECAQFNEEMRNKSNIERCDAG